MSVPSAAPRWNRAAPSGFARGRRTTSTRSRIRSKRPEARSWATTISASAPAGSSPCCPATITTAGRRVTAVTAAEPIEGIEPEAAPDADAGGGGALVTGDSAAGGRRNTRPRIGSPDCERPSSSTLTSAPPPKRRSSPCRIVRSSALLVNSRRPASNAGVAKFTVGSGKRAATAGGTGAGSGGSGTGGGGAGDGTGIGCATGVSDGAGAGAGTGGTGAAPVAAAEGVAAAGGVAGEAGAPVDGVRDTTGAGGCEAQAATTSAAIKGSPRGITPGPRVARIAVCPPPTSSCGGEY
jgi:hypothetical protein